MDSTDTTEDDHANTTETTDSGFYKYFSIDNPNKKHLKYLNKYGYLDKSIEWIALEKIHGANFSFIVDNDKVLVAKRTGLIKTDENFYHCDVVRDKYTSDAMEIYKRIKTENPLVLTINIFGELFGGRYPGIRSPMNNPVQKGVFYSPNIEFLVFDIRINFDSESWFISHDEINSLLINLTMKVVPILHKGTFDQIIKLDPIFESTIYTMFNLAPVKNNMAEGYVLKTNQRHDCHYHRPIIKNKNGKTFGEVHSTEHEKANQELDLTKNKFIPEIIPYCTQQRFNNTISKIGINNPIEKIRGIYVADVVDDFRKNLTDKSYEEFDSQCRQIKLLIIKYLTLGDCLDIWLSEYTNPDTD